MPEMRTAFIEIPRIDGLAGLVRADSITALLPQEAPKNGSPFLLIQVGTHQTVRTELTKETVLAMMANAAGLAGIPVIGPDEIA